MRWIEGAVAWAAVVAFTFGIFTTSPAEAFDLNSRWSSTATDGSGLSQGDPTTLTWSIIPDGTRIFGAVGEPTSDSDLISFLDGIRGAGPGGSDLTQRPWFPVFDDAFSRLEDLSGLTFTYVTDDGASFSGFSGSLGSRGDMRIGGHAIDGQSGPNTLAYNFYPNTGDMVIDTDNINFYNSTTNNSRGFRNVLMHEFGHGLGIRHVESSNAGFLMEPFISTSFDGPQLDDILALQRHYGDVHEKNGGNDSAANALALGALASHASSITVGTAGDSTTVAGDETDFLSIDDSSDVDFFSFNVGAGAMLDAILTPRGTTYNQGEEGEAQSPLDTRSLSDLILTLLDTDGSSILATANASGAGFGESILNHALPDAGEYFLRVSGVDNNVQLYGLSLALAPEPASLLLIAGGTSLLLLRRRAAA